MTFLEMFTARLASLLGLLFALAVAGALYGVVLWFRSPFPGEKEDAKWFAKTGSAIALITAAMVLLCAYVGTRAGG